MGGRGMALKKVASKDFFFSTFLGTGIITGIISGIISGISIGIGTYVCTSIVFSMAFCNSGPITWSDLSCSVLQKHNSCIIKLFN